MVLKVICQNQCRLGVAAQGFIWTACEFNRNVRVEHPFCVRIGWNGSVGWLVKGGGVYDLRHRDKCLAAQQPYDLKLFFCTRVLEGPSDFFDTTIDSGPSCWFVE